MKKSFSATTLLLFSVGTHAQGECGNIKERLEVKSVETETPVGWSKQVDNPATFWEALAIPHIVLAPDLNGGAQVGWMEHKAANIRVTPLNPDLERGGDDVVIKGALLRDLLAHEDGFTAMYFYNSRMSLDKRNAKGERAFFSAPLGAYYSSAMHMGSVYWRDPNYAAYYAVHNGGHEGDALNFHSDKGVSRGRHWDWGCSHSIDMRVVLSTDNYLYALCLTEAYPAMGFVINNRGSQVIDTVSGGSGSTTGRIGGFVEIKDKLAVAYSKVTNLGWRHYLAVISKDLSKGLKIVTRGILSDQAGGEENLKIARYGEDHLLISWFNRKENKSHVRIVNEDGQKLVRKEFDLSFKATPRSDFKTLPNGDVVWASVWGEANELKISRIKYCKEEV